MSDIEWRKLPGFEKYYMSSEGELKRIAYDEPDTGRHMKEIKVRPYRSGPDACHVSVRLLSEDGHEVFRSLNVLINLVFPEYSKDKCYQLAEDVYSKSARKHIQCFQLEGEIWKDCARYEEILQVSNLGRVKRKARKIIRSNGRPYTVTEKILKQSTEGRDYKYITVNLSSGDSVYESVHRLVAETFIPNPDNLPEVNHKDGNGGNNRVDNARHAWDTGLYRKPHPVVCIETGQEFESAYALADTIGIYYTTVQNKISCKSPIHGFHYQYKDKI